MSYPLLFYPILKERVWGGDALAKRYGKAAPAGVRVGESWEITDRPEGTSVVANGPWLGKTLPEIIAMDPAGLLGTLQLRSGRFPWLMKILDARENLSLQVHPPMRQAVRLGGEPKTEIWHVAHAEPEARFFAGLKQGVGREEFVEALRHGEVQRCFHEIPVSRGDTLFVPSGRVHALGAGIVMFEIQQNSDTTYRVFDWNRLGVDGKPRALHVEESLACIDFGDYEPGLVVPQAVGISGMPAQRLLADPLFCVASADLPPRSEFTMKGFGGAVVVAVVEGAVKVSGNHLEVDVGAGAFCLIPAACREWWLQTEIGARVLLVEPGQS